MIGVHLRDLEFHAYHGIHPQETIAGGPFLVQLSVYYRENSSLHSLENGIDYTALFGIVKSKMEIPTGLLENVAENIAQQIKSSFPQVCKVEIDITKVKPPIAGFDGKTAVTLSREY